MANVFDVADFFIEYFRETEENDLTNLKINKLLYYAQGHYLTRTGKPLFNAKIEAWDLGPVIPDVYRKYKSCGKKVLVNTKQYENNLTDEEFDTLLDVAAKYGKYTAAHLVDKTHSQDTPWANTPKGNVISIDDIETHFNNAPRLMSLGDIFPPGSIPSEFPPELDSEADDAWVLEIMRG
jgi:uncharacterized phage-associated protein